ncbi:MAG: hypothetical protein ACTSP1_09935 [Candidatus Freyarchaeota archaeon]
MGLSDSEKLEIIELVRKEISTLFSGKAVATKDDIKLLMEHTDKRFEDMNKRFEELIHHTDKRFEDMNKRFEELIHHTDKRFEDMNKRFEELARLIRLYFAIFGVAVTVLTVIVGLASVLGKPF